jgi:hypothetical protein
MTKGHGTSRIFFINQRIYRPLRSEIQKLVASRQEGRVLKPLAQPIHQLSIEEGMDYTLPLLNESKEFE